MIQPNSFDVYLKSTTPGQVLRNRETGQRFVRIDPGSSEGLFELSICRIGVGTIHLMSEFMLHEENFHELFEIES